MLDGPAKDSCFDEIYEKNGSNTKIVINVNFILHGKLKIIGFFAKKYDFQRKKTCLQMNVFSKMKSRRVDTRFFCISKKNRLFVILRPFFVILGPNKNVDNLQNGTF